MMNSILWRQEFEASIKSFLGAVYPEFSKKNIGPIHFNPKQRLVFGVDFNRTPFYGCIMQVQGDTLAVLKEYTLVDPDTESMASAVRRDFPNFEIWLTPTQRADAFNPPRSWA